MKKYILPIVMVLGIVLVSLFVTARMTFIQEDDGLYNMYNNEIILEKGWNLINFGGELKSDSEIKQGDIKAIFYYNPSSKQYVRYFPESEEWNKLAGQNSCGDQSCNPEERNSFANWCYKDCKSELNNDIISNLNVITEKTITLKKNEKQTLDFSKYYDMEVYWNENSVSGSCSERGYSNVDCVMLHHDIISKGLQNDNEFINSPNDGNPYNDRFGISYPIETYTDQVSVIYAKVDYGSSKDEYKITFYEIDDNRVKTGSNELPIPSVQAKIISQPAWVYSTKRGLLKTESASIKLSQNPLQSGWNFVTITPEFDGKSWNQIKEDCNVLSAYVYNSESQKWVDLQSLYGTGTFGEAAEQGQGIVVKVSGSCYLKASIGSGTDNEINPPTVPSSDEGNFNLGFEEVEGYSKQILDFNDNEICDDNRNNCVKAINSLLYSNSKESNDVIFFRVTKGAETIKSGLKSSEVTSYPNVYKNSDTLSWFYKTDEYTIVKQWGSDVKGVESPVVKYLKTNYPPILI